MLFLSGSLYLGGPSCTPSSASVLSELESSELSDSVDLTSLSSSFATFLLSLGGYSGSSSYVACFGAKVMALNDHFPFEPHI